jgi:hypothetical protein
MQDKKIKKMFGCSDESSNFATTVKVNDSRESLTRSTPRHLVKVKKVKSPKTKLAVTENRSFLLQPSKLTIRANR